MKHVSVVTKHHPAKAAGAQELICYLAHSYVSLVEAKGGEAPNATYLDNKCDTGAA